MPRRAMLSSPDYVGTSDELAEELGPRLGWEPL
jgi:hypothetical protein